MRRRWVALFCGLAGSLLAVAPSARAVSAIPPARQWIAELEPPTNGDDGDVWIQHPDGSGRHRLGPGRLAVVSPDGRTVAVDPGILATTITLYSTTSRRTRTLTVNEPDLIEVYPDAFSPDGRYLAVQCADGPTAIIDVRTDQVTRTLSVPFLSNAFDFSPTPPDRVAWAGGPHGSIDVAHADGSGPIRALAGTARTQLLFWGRPGIAFSVPGHGRGRFEPRVRLMLWRTPGDVVRLPGDESPVAWSADNNVLAVTGGTITIGSRSVRPLGGNRVALGISPNGRGVLWQSFQTRSDQLVSIGVQHSDGGSVRTLATGLFATWNL